MTTSATNEGITRNGASNEGASNRVATQLFTLPNGLRVVITPMPASQAAAVAYYAGVGSRDETREVNGVSHYIEHMLFKGTELRPEAAAISEAIEGAGGTLNAYTTKELTCYWNNLPFEQVTTGIEVVADMIQHSLFEQAEIERERTVVQQEIRRAHDAPGSFVGELIGYATFGDQPIGWPIAGSLETVGAISRDQMIAHLDQYYAAENSVLAVAGNVDVAEILDTAAREFDALTAGEAAVHHAAVAARPDDYIRIEERELEQTNLALSVLGPARRDPDRFPLDIMCTALGRGMSSRLFKEVRERRGLAYSVSCGSVRYRDIGSVSVSAGVTRENQEEALRVIVAELRRMAEEPMPEEELRRTKDYAAGSFRLSLETPMSLAQRTGNQVLQDGEIEEPDSTVEQLRAVTAEDVQRVARRVFEDARFSLAVVGPSASADVLDGILHG